MNEYAASEEAPCPIWGTQADIAPVEKFRLDDICVFDSPRAGGGYWVVSKAERTLSACDQDTRARLTSWLIKQRQLGIPFPEITINTIQNARERKPLSVHERGDGLLKYIQKSTSSIGKLFYFKQAIYDPQSMKMLAWSESTNQKDLGFLMGEFLEFGWLKEERRFCYTLTMKGYARLEELENKVINSSQAFVAMWIDQSMKDTWEKGIEPGIRDAGYQPLRIDQKEHSNKIDDEIIAEIKRSRFVVADFTHGEAGARGSVYYEAGFAHGLNIPVIFTCRKDALENIHFDTRQYNHIAWENPDNLRRELATRIAAVNLGWSR